MSKLINQLQNDNEKFTKQMLEFAGKFEDGTAEDDEAEFPDVGNMADSIRSQIKDQFCTQIDFDTFKIDCNKLQNCDFGLKNIFNKNFKLSDIFQNDKIIDAVLFAGIQQYDTQFFGNDITDVISNFHQSLKIDSQNCDINDEGTKVRLFACGHLNHPNKEKCILCENLQYKDIVIVK